MAATSGITPPPELAAAFVEANTSDNIRFIKVSIVNEVLVHDMIPAQGSFDDDLAFLQGIEVLEDDIPAYILAKKAPSDWLAITYVPDTSKVRDKMLYASTSNSLVKAFGSSLFTDTLFANSKDDLTPEAYLAHRRHTTAPKPLSEREEEMAKIRMAESGGAYVGSRTRANHIGSGVSLRWSEGIEDAIGRLGEIDRDTLVILRIDSKTETLLIESISETSAASLGSALPLSEPCYAFYWWLDTQSSKRQIVFIYSCPPGSPIKDRMLYSSGVSSTYAAAKKFFLTLTTPIYINPRKFETTNPSELNENYMREELGDTSPQYEGHNPMPNEAQEKKLFARPRGPGRRR